MGTLLGDEEKPRRPAPGQATPAKGGALRPQRPVQRPRARELPSGLSAPGWHLLGTGTRVPIHSFPLSGLGTPLLGRAAPQMRKQGPERYVACHFSCDKRHVILSYFSDMGAISSVETREARYREIKSLTHGQITSRRHGWYLNAGSCDFRAGGLSRRASFCLFKVKHLPQNPSAHRRSTGTGVQVTCALSFIHSFIHSWNATLRPQQAVVLLPRCPR